MCQLLAVVLLLSFCCCHVVSLRTLHPTPPPQPQDLVSRLAKPTTRLVLLADVVTHVAAQHGGAPAILSHLHKVLEERRGQAEEWSLVKDMLD